MAGDRRRRDAIAADRRSTRPAAGPTSRARVVCPHRYSARSADRPGPGVRDPGAFHGPRTKRCRCVSHGSARSQSPARPGAKGKGIFAVDSIPAGTTVAGFGGHVVDRAELDALAEEIRTHALQNADDLFSASELPFDAADYVNHSCDPNCGIVGSVLLVTMREVAAGEELCFDYAMTDTDDYDEFTCSCGTPMCRGVVSGSDWTDPELRDRYRGWSSAYIERRIS